MSDEQRLDPERTALVQREIRALHNSLANALSTRKAHPTYGYTKAGLWKRLHSLEGALFIYLWATGRHNMDLDLGAREAAAEFDIDLTALHVAVKNA